MTEHNKGDRRVGELAAAFGSMPSDWAKDHVASFGLDVSDGELSVMRAWDRMTRDVVTSKFDCCVTQAYDSATVDGLNATVGDRYLSDDPTHAFELPNAFDLGRFGRSGAAVDGYGYFDYAEFERLLLEDDALFDDENFRDEVQSQRKRGSLFSKRQHRGRTTRRTPMQGHALASADDAGQPRAMRLEGDGADDRAFVHAYPEAMGRAGATMLTQTQRRPGRMIPKSRRAALAKTVRQAARTAARNGAISGPAVQRQASTLGRPTWAPTTFDASVATGLPLTAGIPWNSPAAATAGDTPGIDATRRMDTTPQVLDGLAISRQHFPALSGALAISGAAFGTPGDGHAAIPGVFSPSKLESALRLVSMSQNGEPVAGMRTHEPAAMGYDNLLYDAAEHAWLSTPKDAVAPFDAAESVASPKRAGRAVSHTEAAARQIARALPTTSRPELAAEQAVGVPSRAPLTSRTLTTQQAQHQMVSQPADNLGWTAPVVAPIAGMDIAAGGQLEAAIIRHLPATSERSDVRTGVGALPAPGAAHRPGSGPIGTRAQSQSLHQITRSARSVEAGARRLAAATMASSSALTGFLAQTGPRGVFGVTSTGPEMFAAAAANRSRADMASLTRPTDGPVTTAGEVRTGYGSLAGAYDDPVVYLAARDEAQSGRRASANESVVARTAAMAPQVATHLHALSMPLSSASALAAIAAAPSTESFDASTPQASIHTGARRSQTQIGTAIRTADSIVTGRPLRALQDREIRGTSGASGLGGERPELSTLTPMTPGLAAVSDASVFYEFAFDPEVAYVHGDSPVAGGHVEVRDGKIVRSVPATAAAERRNASRSSIGSSRMGTQSVAAEGDHAVRPAGRRAVMTGASSLESGFPALSLSSSTASLDVSNITPKQAAVLATRTEAELAMLPTAVRANIERLASQSAMTAAGTDSAGLLARLARVADPTAPGARSSLLRQLATLGVDTPELLSIIGDSPTGAPPSAAGGADVDAGWTSNRAMQQIVAQMTGIAGAGAAESSVDNDSYWGQFAPSKIVQSNAADMIRALLSGADGATRPSALAYGAEMGEFLAVGSAAQGGMGSNNIAKAVATGRRLTSSGAPTQAARAATRDGRRAEAVRQREHAVSARAEILAERMLTERRIERDQSTTQQAQVAAESFADRIGGAVAESLQSGATAKAAGSALPGMASPSELGWDNDLTLTATPQSSLAGRVDSSATPWEAKNAGKAPAVRSIGGTESPLMRALRADRPDATLRRDAPMHIGSADLGPVGQLLSADGSRGFSALGSAQAQAILEHLPTRRTLASALGGGLDLARSVINRANGAFANLDAGVMSFLGRRAGGGSLPQQSGGRELQPGLDEWPAETMDMLRSSGWGVSTGAPDAEPAQAQQTQTHVAAGNTDERVQRLERRLGAAKAAYQHLASSGGRAAGGGHSTDSIDWSLVNTGAQAEVPHTANLGRLADTMVRPTGLPAAEMSYLAPAVKVVAQQAQMHGSGDESSSGSAPTRAAAEGGGKRGGQAQDNKPDIEALARQIHSRLRNRWRRDGERQGRY